MRDARPARVFRVTGSVVLFVLCALVAAALLIDAAVRSGGAQALLLAPWMLLVLWAVYVVGIASDVRADRRGVHVQNLLRRTWIPWSRVKRIAMRWQLELTLDDGVVVRCFGSPARSRPRRIGPERTREDGNETAEDGIARMQRLRLDAEIQPDAVVVRTWDWASIIALAVLVVWAAVAVFATR
ncbi:PH domain-containing protein [Microbacterium sp. A204]|uniref:PH domain-containing protein n=1 Tax=Microbacterium sp. A204 TaxID=3457321 RepID=UPI003FD10155